MTLEEMQLKFKELQDKQQEEYITKLLDMVENLEQKANDKNYQPTEKERVTFNQIRTIINNMNSWF